MASSMCVCTLCKGENVAILDSAGNIVVKYVILNFCGDNMTTTEMIRFGVYHFLHSYRMNME